MHRASGSLLGLQALIGQSRSYMTFDRVLRRSGSLIYIVGKVPEAIDNFNSTATKRREEHFFKNNGNLKFITKSHLIEVTQCYLGCISNCI